jgi:quercetin dioxygenase-like cupin family protein
MAGTSMALEELPWETWDDPGLADRSGVRWKLVFSGQRTPTGAMSVGLAEIGPGGVLPLHHHAPAEVYHVLEGQGRAEVEGVSHELRPGRLLFIPAGARHRTTNTGPGPLRFLFVFPTDSFEQVVYHFDE